MGRQRTRLRRLTVVTPPPSRRHRPPNSSRRAGNGSCFKFTVALLQRRFVIIFGVEVFLGSFRALAVCLPAALCTIDIVLATDVLRVVLWCVGALRLSPLPSQLPWCASESECSSCCFSQQRSSICSPGRLAHREESPYAAALLTHCWGCNTERCVIPASPANTLHIGSVLIEHFIAFGRTS